MVGNTNCEGGEQADADRSEGSTGGEKGTHVGCIGGRRTSGDAPEVGAMAKEELDLETQSPWLS